MARRRSLGARLLEGWLSPAASWRSEWAAGGGEPRLLAIAFGASVFLLLGALAVETIRPEAAASAERTPWFAARILVGLSFTPLAMYAAAGLLGLICRVFGGAAPGGGSHWRAVRLAFFWSGFVSGPVAALLQALAAAAGASFAAALGGIVWLGLLAPMLAEAQGFRASRVAAVFAIVAALALSLRFLG